MPVNGKTIQHEQHQTRRSPALDFQSEHYPERFNGKVPKRVRLLRTIHSDLTAFIASGEFLFGVVGQEYDCLVNSHGAVSIVSALYRDSMLGLKPDEFEVVEFH